MPLSRSIAWPAPSWSAMLSTGRRAGRRCRRWRRASPPATGRERIGARQGIQTDRRRDRHLAGRRQAAVASGDSAASVSADGVVRPGAVRPGAAPVGLVSAGLASAGSVRPGPVAVSDGSVALVRPAPGVVRPGVVRPGVVRPGRGQPRCGEARCGQPGVQSGAVSPARSGPVWPGPARSDVVGAVAPVPVSMPVGIGGTLMPNCESPCESAHNKSAGRSVIDRGLDELAGSGAGRVLADNSDTATTAAGLATARAATALMAVESLRRRRFGTEVSSIYGLRLVGAS